MKDAAAISPGEEIRARDGKSKEITAKGAIALGPLGMQWIRSGEYEKHNKEESATVGKSENCFHLFLPFGK